jgi:hypothetical protein
MNKYFTTYKVWDKKTFTEFFCKKIAMEHFEDLAETFEFPNHAFIRLTKVEVLSNNEKVYSFDIFN